MVGSWLNYSCIGHGICTYFKKKKQQKENNSSSSDQMQSQPAALRLIELAVTGQNTCSLLCSPPYDRKRLQEHNNSSIMG